MCNCHSILECCVMFSGVKLSIRSFNLFQFPQLATCSFQNGTKSVVIAEDYLYRFKALLT